MGRLGQVLIVAIIVASPLAKANAFDIGSLLASMESPFCDVDTIEDKMWSVCEWDDAKRAAGQCVEQVPVFKQVRFRMCAHIGHLMAPLQNAQLDPGTESVRRAILALRDVVKPEPPDLSFTGPYMPAGPCRTIGEKMGSYVHRPYYVKRLDTELKGWRECMNMLALDLQSGLNRDPVFAVFARLQEWFLALEAADPQKQAQLDAFVLVIEDAPFQSVTLERALELLGVP